MRKGHPQSCLEGHPGLRKKQPWIEKSRRNDQPRGKKLKNILVDLKTEFKKRVKAVLRKSDCWGDQRGKEQSKRHARVAVYTSTVLEEEATGKVGSSNLIKDVETGGRAGPNKSSLNANRRDPSISTKPMNQ